MAVSIPALRAGRGLEAELAAAVERFSSRNGESAALFERACHAMPGGNTRTSLWQSPFPLRMVHGEGCRLRDADGHVYVDFLGEFTSGIAGHSHPVLKAAISSALERGMNLSAHNDVEVELAERLCARIPSIESLRFTNSGTEANLMALALAKAATGRDRIVVFDHAYHGALLAFSPAGAGVRAPHDYIVLPYNDLAAVEQAAGRMGGEMAAILVEPMLGAGGCVPAAPDFLAGLRRIASETGALLIFDEVQTSRLSPGGRQQLLGILPDLTTIGKYFGGGLAFGAFGGRRDLMQRFDPRRTDALMHAGTFNNNSLAMSAGLAAVTEILTPEALAALNRRGEGLRHRLNDLFARAGAPFEATGLGSIMNIHARSADPLWNRNAMRLVYFDLLQHGQYMAERGLIALSIPLGHAEIEGLLAALESILSNRPCLTGQVIEE